MNTLAALPHSPSSRYVGIGFVVALHVVAVIAISNGLMQKTPPPQPPHTEVVIIPDLSDPQPPPLPMPRLQPNLPTSDPIPVPVPEVPITAPPPTTITTQALDKTASPPNLSGGSIAPVQPQVSTTPPPAGAVCTKMPAPEVPTLNWSGEALFRVVASTQNGRVDALTIQALRGGMDSRSLRTVKAAIERTLREGYECPGNVQFTQEFQFRIE